MRSLASSTAESERPAQDVAATDGWGPILDGVGLLLSGSAAVWTLVAARSSGGHSGPILRLLGAATVAYVIARLVSLLSRAIVPLLVALAGAYLLIAQPSNVLSRAPLSNPFGYSNARAAFFALAAGAVLMLAAHLGRDRPVPRVLGLLAAAPLAAVPFATHTYSAVAVVGGLTLAAVLVWSPRSARVAIAAALIAFLVILTVTVALGWGFHRKQPGPLERAAEQSALTQRRLELWHDAVVLMRAHPITGVGPGRFQLESPVARSDRDARWAHNAFLQQGAEQGIPGMALLVLLFVWGFVRLWVARRPDAMSALGAAALAGIGAAACVDYILHFPAIPIALAALLGAAVSVDRPAERAVAA